MVEQIKLADQGLPSSIPKDRDTTIIIGCSNGASAEVARVTLEEYGYVVGSRTHTHPPPAHTRAPWATITPPHTHTERERERAKYGREIASVLALLACLQVNADDEIPA